MATARLVLRRLPNKKNLYPVVILISHKGTNTELATKIEIDKTFWRDGKIIKGCKDISNVRESNMKLSYKLNEALEFIEELEKRRRIDIMSAKQIGDYIKKGGKDYSDRDFFEYMEQYIPKIPNPSTQEKYSLTLIILRKYTNHLFFSEITKPWLYRFREWRLQNSTPATTNIDLRNIRAVINRAIDIDEIIGQELYPFRKFEFCKAQPRNLRLSVDQIKSIRDFQTGNKYHSMARDLFMLSFYLVGMNNSDIYDLKEIRDGRVEYMRNKTSKPYSIKAEPEALRLIEKYKGRNQLLAYSEMYANSRNFTKQVNKYLKKIGESKEVNTPDLVMYHARHSWAGIAAKKPIGASKPLIAQALGHGRITVTDTYFDYDNELVDDLNRRVLDALK